MAPIVAQMMSSCSECLWCKDDSRLSDLGDLFAIVCSFYRLEEDDLCLLRRCLGDLEPSESLSLLLLLLLPELLKLLLRLLLLLLKLLLKLLLRPRLRELLLKLLSLSLPDEEDPLDEEDDDDEDEDLSQTLHFRHVVSTVYVFAATLISFSFLIFLFLYASVFHQLNRVYPGALWAVLVDTAWWVSSIAVCEWVLLYSFCLFCIRRSIGKRIRHVEERFDATLTQCPCSKHLWHLVDVDAFLLEAWYLGPVRYMSWMGKRFSAVKRKGAYTEG